jgi:uncharacterized protein DUF2071
MPRDEQDAHRIRHPETGVNLRRLHWRAPHLCWLEQPLSTSWSVHSLKWQHDPRLHEARAFLNLPYYAAVMSVECRDAAVHYQSARRSRGRAEFNATYEPAGAPFAASVGSIEYFLTERYCLYHHDRRGRPYRLEIQHRPWSLQLARATITINTMAVANHLTINGSPPLLHFARRQDVVAWTPSRLPTAIIGATERHRVAQLCDGRDVMFIGIPRVLRHEICRAPREHDLVGRRSPRRLRRG